MSGRRTVFVATLALLVVPSPVAAGAAPPPTAGTGRLKRLSDGAPSPDLVIERLLRALRTNDLAALERLRVNRAEYLDIVLPGNVEPGQRPQRIPDYEAAFFWDLLDTKSRYAARGLLAEFGGRTLEVRRVNYAKGVHRYARFVSLGQLRLTLADEHGVEHGLGTGTIVGVKGSCKFVSFVRD